METVHLRDGSPVSIRPVTPLDEPALHSLLANLSPEARRLRFFTGAADIDQAACRETVTDPDHYGLIAHDSACMAVGHAAYIRLDERRAEVAVEISDHLHDRGLGTILIERLAAVAEHHGITDFVAEVLHENHEMLDAFRDGFDAQADLCVDMDTVEFPTATWHLTPERFGS